MLLVVLIQMGLRGTGDSLTPLWFMVLSVVLDVGAQPAADPRASGRFPKMGIAGSATATLIANYRRRRRRCSSTSMRATCRSGCAARSCAT